mmetsp:Transcript_59139/g.123530  ORF Transcript_59139/g.123530 Transcript_59139/m.123530 type:complete len:85 (+) Transcript_59139:160-414(+)
MVLIAEDEILTVEDEIGNVLVTLIAVTVVVGPEKLVFIRSVAVEDTVDNVLVDNTTEQLADDVAPSDVEYLPVLHVRHVVVPVC